MMSRQKIYFVENIRSLYLQPALPEFPVSLSLHELALAMTSLGCDVTVICPRGAKQYDIPYHIQILKRSSEIGKFFRSFDFVAETVFGLGAAIHLRCVVGYERSNIVIYENYISCLLASLLHARGVRVFRTAGPIPSHAFGLGQLLPSLVRIMAFKSCDLIVTGSRSVRSDLLQTYSTDPEKTKVVYEGIGGPEFAPVDMPEKLQLKMAYGLRDGAKTLLSVGLLGPRKNQLALVRSLPSIIRRFPELICIFVGATESQAYLYRIKQLIQDLALSEKVRFKGFLVRHEELARYYQLADVYVHLSIAEGLPKAVVEAMRCGVPIVLSDIPSHRELETLGFKAILVDPGNPEVVADAITEILTNHEVWKRNCEWNAKLAYSLFDHRTCALKLVQAAEKIRERRVSMSLVESPRSFRGTSLLSAILISRLCGMFRRFRQ